MTDKDETQNKISPLRTMWYGIEKYTKVDDPHTVITRFFKEDKAKKWFETENRVAIYSGEHRYIAVKYLYKMPWYWRPPTKKKALAYLEENNPLRRHSWNLIDITGEVISKIGEGVIL